METDSASSVHTPQHHVDPVSSWKRPCVRAFSCHARSLPGSSGVSSLVRYFSEAFVIFGGNFVTT
eukprot:2662742-Rhodomonas_salina.1